MAGEEARFEVSGQEIVLAKSLLPAEIGTPHLPVPFGLPESSVTKGAGFADFGAPSHN